MPFIQKVHVTLKTSLIYDASYFSSYKWPIVFLRAPNFAATCPHHCQEICQSSCPTHCCASPYVSTMEQSQSIQESCPTICSSSCLPSYPFFVVRCLRWCQAHVQAVALWAAFCHANNIVVKSAICPLQSAIHFDDMCPAHHCPASSEQLSFSTKFLTPIGNV